MSAQPRLRPTRFEHFSQPPERDACGLDGLPAQSYPCLSLPLGVLARGAHGPLIDPEKHLALQTRL